MKIAMIVPALVNKGPENVARDLCTQYVREGHYCKVFYFDTQIELSFPCDTQRIGFFECPDFSSFDIVHTHQYRPDVYAYIHRLRKFGVVIISTLHQHIEQQLKFDNSRSFWKNKIGIITWLFVLRYFNKIVSLSDFHNTYYLSKRINSCVVENGRFVDTHLDIDEADKSMINALKNKYIVLSSVAYITIRKGLDQLLHAISSDDRYALMIVGDGPDLIRLKQIAVNIGLSERCVFLGNKPNGYRYLRYADAFILCSYAEGFPLALIEASAYKLPCVCSDIEAIKSVMNSNEVVYYHLNDIDSLKNSIDTAIKQSTILSKSIWQKYNKCFSAKAMADKYLDVYSHELKSC